MRKLIATTLVLAILLGGFNLAHALIKTSNLKYATRFEGNANDWSGNQAGNTSNAVTYVAGKFGQAGDFNGTTSYLNAGSTSTVDNLCTGACTISVWFNARTISAGNDGLFEKGTGSKGWDSEISATSGNTFKFRFVKYFSTTRGNWSNTNFDFATSTWTNFIITYDGSSLANDPTFYKNCLPVAVTETQTPVGAATDDSADSLYIGSNNAGADGNWDGQIDEIRFYSRILTASEIRSLCLNYDPSEF